MTEPVQNIFDAIEPVLTRWTMGGAAAPVAPPPWNEVIGTEPVEAELRLLALSGQYLSVLVQAEPAEALRALPDLPALAMPSLTPALRPLARRILQAMREGRQRRDLIQFVARRGWTLHPGDWMPAAGDDDLPDVYAPWRDWAEAAASLQAVTGKPTHGLTAENWEDYWPAARGVALAELRRRDPAAALAVFEAKFAEQNADARVRLLALLANGLSEADRPFLESLAGDRAPRVKALATSLLGRLGHGSAVGEDDVELAGFFEVKAKGLLRRTQVVAPLPLKTPAQTGRRRALMAETDITAFAAALKLSPDDLVASWSWRTDAGNDHELIAMAERSAPETVIALLYEMLGSGDTVNVQHMQALQPRLTPAQCTALAVRVLGANGGTFQMALAIAGGGCGIDRVIDLAVGRTLVAALQTSEDGTRRPDQLAELQALGLVASRGAASAALDRLAVGGMLAADPRLDMLRFNAALEDTAMKDGGTE